MALDNGFLPCDDPKALQRICDRLGSGAVKSFSELQGSSGPHRALRTEVVVGDTRDFGIGRRVNAESWHALRAVGEQAKQASLRRSSG